MSITIVVLDIETIADGPSIKRSYEERIFSSSSLAIPLLIDAFRYIKQTARTRNTRIPEITSSRR